MSAAEKASFTYFFCYDRYMKTVRPFPLLIFLALLWMPSQLLAESEAMPPPTVQEADSSPKAMQESAPDLREELKSTEGEGGGYSIDVRSYQRKDGATITEYSVQGRVYKIKVQPAGGLPAYYLYDREGNGNFEQRLPGGGKRLNPPTWVLKEF